MDRKSLNERLKAAPNPVIDAYRKVVGSRANQTMDTNHVGWRLLEYLVFKDQSRFFTRNGHWLSWKNSAIQKAARSNAEKAVSIGITLTQYWRGQNLNLMQVAMIKPYLNLDRNQLLGKKR